VRKILLAIGLVLALTSCQRGPVEVNSADRRALESVTEIGPKTAEAIIQERTKAGDFKDWKEFISRVKGVGEKSAAKMSADGLTVNGQPIGGGATKTQSGSASTQGRQ
jgi:competence protein ComEA